MDTYFSGVQDKIIAVPGKISFNGRWWILEKPDILGSRSFTDDGGSWYKNDHGHQAGIQLSISKVNRTKTLLIKTEGSRRNTPAVYRRYSSTSPRPLEHNRFSFLRHRPGDPIRKPPRAWSTLDIRVRADKGYRQRKRETRNIHRTEQCP